MIKIVYQQISASTYPGLTLQPPPGVIWRIHVISVNVANPTAGAVSMSCYYYCNGSGQSVYIFNQSIAAGATANIVLSPSITTSLPMISQPLQLCNNEIVSIGAIDITPLTVTVRVVIEEVGI